MYPRNPSGGKFERDFFMPKNWEKVLVYLLVAVALGFVVTLALLSLPASGKTGVDLPSIGGGR